MKEYVAYPNLIELVWVTLSFAKEAELHWIEYILLSRLHQRKVRFLETKIILL